MQEAIGRFFKSFSTVANAAVRRHPLEVVVGVALALLLSGAIESVWDDELAASLTTASVPALMLVFGATYLQRLGAIGLGARLGMSVAGLGLWGWWAWEMSQEFLVAELWRLGLATSGLGAALLLVPLAARGSEVPPGLRTWRTSYKLVSFVGINTLYLLALCGGLALAVVSVETLFDLEVRGELYGHLAAWIFAVGSPWMLAARTEEVYAFEEEVGAESLPWVSRMSFYLTLPLVSVYLIITYAYALRVIFTDYAPSNVISPLILGAGVLMWAAREQVEPMRRKGGYETLVRVVDALPVAVGPMVPLAIWAVVTRIGQYGWTEFRYVRLVVLVALLVICGMGTVAYIRRRPMKLWMAPAVLAGFALIGAVGPLSASAVAERSQVGRLEVQAAELGVLDAQGKIDAEKVGATSDEGGAELANLASYVRDHFGTEALRSFAPEGLSPERLAAWETRLVNGRWGHLEDQGWTVKYLLTAKEAPFDVDRPATLSRFDTVLYSTRARTPDETPDGESLQVSVVDDVMLEVQRGEVRWRADLSAQVAAARATEGSREKLQEALRRVVLYDADGERRGEVVIEDVTIRFRESQSELVRVNGMLVVER